MCVWQNCHTTAKFDYLIMQLAEYQSFDSDENWYQYKYQSEYKTILKYWTTELGTDHVKFLTKRDKESTD